MLKTTYVIHGLDVQDCYRLQKENGLNRDECVYTLIDFASDKAKDTELYKHIWTERKHEGK